MTNRWLVAITLSVGAMAIFAAGTVWGDQRANREALKAVQAKGGVVLDEVAAIANILAKNPDMAHFNSASQEYCLLSLHKYMVHFSNDPSKTDEDILYFLDPDPFVGAGLKLADLAPLPRALGQMEPLRWYYYDGSYTEPHHSRTLPPYLVMAYSVKH